MPNRRPTPPRDPRRAPRRTSAGGPVRHAGAPRPKPVLRQYRPYRRRRVPGWVWLVVLVGVAFGGWKLYGAVTSVERAPSRAEQPAAAAEKPAAKPRASESAAAKRAREAVKVGSYLGGSAERDLAGFGPAPDRLDLIWSLRLGSGPTRRKSDNRITTWSGSGWTGQPTVAAEGGADWLLLGAYDHNLHRINAASGKVKWESEWPDVMKGTNTIVPNPKASGEATSIIVVSGSRRGVDLAVGDPRIAPLRAVSFFTGKELWRLPIPRTDNYSQDVDSSPLWYKGVLYAPVEPGYVYALDPFTIVVKDGVKQPKVLARSPRLYDDADVRAHPDIGSSNLAIESSPAAIGDTIYVTSGAGHVYGLDRKTLKVVWDFKTGSDIDGTPSVTRDGKLLISIEKQYVAEKGGAYLLDPSKPPEKAVVWYYPTPTRGFGEWAGGCVGSVTSNDGSNDGSKPRLAALNTIDGKVRVISLDRLTSGKAKGPGPAAAAPAPLEVFADGIGGSISTPVIVGDRMVTAGYGNTVYLYGFTYAPAKKTDPEALPSADGRWWTVRVKRLDTFKGGAAFESTPLVYRGRVYIGCRDGKLYCLGG